MTPDKMDADKNYCVIDPDRCKGCGVCVEACPRNCIEIGNHINKLGYPNAVFVKEECIACGMCFYSCPEFGAITIYRKPKKGGAQ